MNTAMCLFCHVNSVPLARWNMRCESCRKVRKEEEAKEIQAPAIGQRQAAAIIIPEGTQKTTVFVDKFGKEVDNPGYDLKNDPRGWKYSGAQSLPRTMIR